MIFSRKAYWPLYLENSRALVFVLDSCDKDKFHEAKSEIENLIKSEYCSHLPMLILGEFFWSVTKIAEVIHCKPIPVLSLYEIAV